MISPLAKKLGLKAGMRALILAPPADYRDLLAPLPGDVTVSSSAAEKYPFVQTFATHLSDLHKFTQILSRHAAPNALVWISYPKKTSGTGSGLSRDLIRRAMSDSGWSTVSIVAVDKVWSALRLRPAGEVGSRPPKSKGRT